jgi:hypothetical protein
MAVNPMLDSSAEVIHHPIPRSVARSIHVFVPDIPDLDGDGCLNTVEVAAGTDPNLVDTDGDGENDCIELGPNIVTFVMT